VVTDLFDLTGQVALVIGAGAGGLGERAAYALDAAGAQLALADLPARADDVAVTAKGCGSVRTASTHEIDVTDEALVEAAIAQVVATHDRVDIVVNAAGTMLRKEYDLTTLEEWNRVIGINLTGTWLVDRAAGKALTAQGNGGRIVNVSTVYAERVGPVPESAYYASKAGIANLTRAMASELGPHGINVNCLAPGVFYPTQMTAAFAESPERLEWFAQRTMLGRNGNPDTDFTGPLLFLASRASSYVTGQVVYVDGGWSAW